MRTEETRAAADLVTVVKAQLKYGMSSEEAWKGIAAIARNRKVPRRTRLRAYTLIVSRTDPVVTNPGELNGRPVNVAVVLNHTGAPLQSHGVDLHLEGSNGSAS